MQTEESRLSTLRQVFSQFLLLGLTSFGGPAAHLGYFQQQFVTRLGWLSQTHFAQLVALSQFLPGPGSSQVGFAIGLHKGGLFGGLAAFIAFTLPSFLLMYTLALFGDSFSSQSWYDGITTGLKLLAVTVVADAVYNMFTGFCKDLQTRFIFATVLLCLLLFSAIWLQILLLVLAGIYGSWQLKQALPDNQQSPNGSINRPAMFIFVGLLICLPVLATWSSQITIVWDHFLAGSLVFGGGHVVLPLLQELVAEDVGTDTFLTGYAAAQAVPGPMFTFATYLGTASLVDSPLLGALLATLGVFAPGLLLVLALQDKWLSLAQQTRFRGFVSGVNAAVVGLLGATLYTPLLVTSITGLFDIVLVITGWVLLKQFKLPIVALVAGFVTIGLVAY